MVENLENEEWRDIEGYEGLYQVSNMGRVKSVNYRRSCEERLLRKGFSKGYAHVRLFKDGEDNIFKVHRLVAKAFIPNDDPINKNDVNHKIEGDEGKKDNRVENLEWCSRKYNNTYGTRLLRVARANRENGNYERFGELTRKRCSKQVAQIDAMTNEIIKIWDSANQAEREGKFLESQISMTCNGKRKSHKGFKWQYL